jgi:WD40-like Beta Propeller Repeat
VDQTAGADEGGHCVGRTAKLRHGVCGPKVISWNLVVTTIAVAITSTADAADSVRPWTPAGISSDLYESHAAFDPRTSDLYFVRSSKTFAGWRILRSHCTGSHWDTPTDAPFAGHGVEADPYFTPNGKSVYFISSRTTGTNKSKDLDIWRAVRASDGHWLAPERLPEPVNSDEAEWFPRPSVDGWLYFGSNRPGGIGKNDIWRAREGKPGIWRTENLGPSVNSAGDEYEPLPSPDGRRLIVATADGLYATENVRGRWTPRKKLGPAINVNGTELGALFSPSGRSLLFARDTGEPKSGEFFVWHLRGHEDWPPQCGTP